MWSVAFGVTHTEGDRVGRGDLGELHRGGQQDRPPEGHVDGEPCRQLGARAASERALVHIAWAIAEGKPNSRAVSASRWPSPTTAAPRGRFELSGDPFLALRFASLFRLPVRLDPV